MRCAGHRGTAVPGRRLAGRSRLSADVEWKLMGPGSSQATNRGPMRQLSSLLSSRAVPARRLRNKPPRDEERRPPEPKPVPKRCLNEAAHKLGR